MPDLNDTDVPPPGPIRTGRPSRLLTVISIIASCTFLTCAGCCFLIMFLFRAQTTNTPEGVNEIAGRITDWKPLPHFTGKSAAIVDNVVLRFDVARYVHEKGRGQLVIAQLQSKLVALPDHRDRTRALMEQYVPELKKIRIEEETVLKTVVRGLPAEFQIGTGEDRASTTKYHQVVGHFRGKVDDAILVLQFEDDVLNEQEIEDFLKSIE